MDKNNNDTDAEFDQIDNSHDDDFDASNTDSLFNDGDKDTEIVQDADESTLETIVKQQSKEIQSTKAHPSATQSNNTHNKGVHVAALSAAAASALFLSWLWVRRQKSRPVKKEQVFLQQLNLSLDVSTTSKLKGKTVAVSDRIDIQGLATRFGSDFWQSSLPPSTSSADVVSALLERGAIVVGTVPSEPLGLGPLFDLKSKTTRKLPNPSARGSINGGGEYGAAVSVSAGIADLALSVDELGSSLIPAACCGAYALRTTQGLCSMTGVFTASPSLASLTLLSTKPEVLLHAAQALNLPNKPYSSNATLTTYLVAEDVFAACGSSVSAAMPAVISSVKRWAGADQAQGLSLCEWLYHRFPTLKSFFNNETSTSSSAAPAAQSKVDIVLDALCRAADVIKSYELYQMYGSWGEENAGKLPQEIRDAFARTGAVRVEEYQRAVAIGEELRDGFKSALQQNVFVLPTLVDPAPKLGAKNLEMYRKRCLQLAALTSLTQAPQIALPAAQNHGKNGGHHPISISLLGLHRSDVSLIETAVKLGPMLVEELTKQQTKKKPSAEKAAAHKAQDEVDVKSQKAAATAAKDEGNIAFKAGRFEAALKHYTTAIQLDAKNAVYYNNRALVYLKMGNYSAAEADCEIALSLDPAAVKALLRRGSARLARGDVAGAREDFERVRVLEPNNKQAAMELKRLDEFESSAY